LYISGSEKGNKRVHSGQESNDSHVVADQNILVVYAIRCVMLERSTVNYSVLKILKQNLVLCDLYDGELMNEAKYTLM